MPTYSANIVPQMTASNAPTPYVISASSQIDATSYPAWKAFNRSVTGNFQSWLTPAGTLTGWLRIDLGVARIVGKYSLQLSNESGLDICMPKNWTFEGSNDTSNWTVLDTRSNEPSWTANARREYTFSNNTAYRYYRINVTANQGSINYLAISEMELMEVSILNKFLISSGNEYYAARPKTKGAEKIIPVMTTYTSNGVTVTGDTDGSSFQAWKLFDGVTSSLWLSNNISSSAKVEIDLGSNKQIPFSYTLTGSADTIPLSPQTWKVYGSNGDGWEELDSQTGIKNWILGETKEFTLKTTNSYNKYRLEIISSVSDGANRKSANEFNLIACKEGYDGTGLIIEPVAVEGSFIKNGMDKNTIVNLDTAFSRKSFVNRGDTAIGSGKVFKQSIDSTKIPIKNVTIT
ncbi:F5/8 type C domain-containing protein [Paenibacillus sophorae]|uniref:Discoidin domain-containing protein n=1 Tax=Paenibacillus sophorae TaxID=1333845 RepID=A0A1H8H7V5_9BACL|nr:discoidin domain-containing protein [Paenibacillus sophorae]QWU14468.1 discoidin domain-containing protein [Paenibacillus sophorae]SEN52119.1 F5/8 type C domain-containing protein [Paenibacillus sophorae]